MLPIIDWTYYSGVIHKDKNKMEESVKNVSFKLVRIKEQLKKMSNV